MRPDPAAVKDNSKKPVGICRREIRFSVFCCPEYVVELTELFKVSTDYILGLSNDSVISTASLTEEQMKDLFALVQYFNRENEKNG